MKIFKDMFTESDNQTYDVFRLLLFISVNWFLALGTYELLSHDHDFQLSQISAGLSALLGFGGAVLGFKAKGEH